MNTSQKFPLLTYLFGMLVGVVLIDILYIGILWFFSIPKGEGATQAVITIVIPGFFLVPLFGGLVAGFFWRRLKPGISISGLGALGITFFCIIGAATILKEGVICLLIVSPLFFVIVFAGTLLARIWFKDDPTKLRISILPLVALLAFVEPLTRADQTGIVVDKILIHAPAAKVWPQLTSFSPIPSPPQYWLFRLGLPYPVETTSGGDFVGADRQCIFSDNMVFREKVTEFTPGRNLTFDITELPQHPELIGHITPERGQFLLQDNGDGTTTLIGSTWYTLHVRPLWYFDWWTGSIFRAVHLRVMDDIRRRAES